MMTASMMSRRIVIRRLLSVLFGISNLSVDSNGNYVLDLIFVANI